MPIEPITTFSADAASRARAELLEYYRQVNAMRMAQSNYLAELGKGIKDWERLQASNRAFFDEYARRWHRGI